MLATPRGKVFWNFPNSLSFLRLFLSPSCLFLLTSWHHKELLVVILMTIAGFTDFFDGYLARKFNQTSRFGAYLDLISDYCYICVSLLIFLHLGLVPIFLVGLYWVRDVVLLSVRGYNANELGIPHKTSLGVAARISIYIALPLSLVVPEPVGYLTFVVCGFLAFCSLFEYVVFFLRKSGLR